MNRVKWSAVLATALALACGSALAETMYRSTMPDGRVIFGDSPAPGAAKVEPLNVRPAQSIGPVVPPQEVQRIQGSTADTLEQRRQAQQQLEEARNALSRAEEAQSNGKEPLPGERLGTAGGGSRLSDDYWARQQRLADAVKEARQKVDDAQAALNALR
jgi:hypothetical protein